MWQLFDQVLSWLQFWLKGDSQLFLFWNKLKSTITLKMELKYNLADNSHNRFLFFDEEK